LIKSKSPQTNVIVLSATHEEESMLKAICSGVSGFLSVNTSPELFIDGIRMVYNGGSLISAELFAKAYNRFSDINAKRSKLNWVENHMSDEESRLLNNFTRIELEVIIQIGRGFSNQEIADVFSLKEGTIRNHVTSILQKTGFRNRTQIAIYAFTIGLLDANVR
jgi:DNA-binding NarL/FixJ family response regulator